MGVGLSALPEGARRCKPAYELLCRHTIRPPSPVVKPQRIRAPAMRGVTAFTTVGDFVLVVLVVVVYEYAYRHKRPVVLLEMFQKHQQHRRSRR